MLPSFYGLCVRLGVTFLVIPSFVVSCVDLQLLCQGSVAPSAPRVGCTHELAVYLSRAQRLSVHSCSLVLPLRLACLLLDILLSYAGDDSWLFAGLPQTAAKPKPKAKPNPSKAKATPAKSAAAKKLAAKKGSAKKATPAKKGDTKSPKATPKTKSPVSVLTGSYCGRSSTTSGSRKELRLFRCRFVDPGVWTSFLLLSQG